MNNRNFEKYLKELPEQKVAWNDWKHNLKDWHCFNTSYTYYLSVSSEYAKQLEYPTSCNCGCHPQVVEKKPCDTTAVCLRKISAPVRLKFQGVLLYSLLHENFNKALCLSLQIEQTSGSKLSECSKTWYLGEHSGTAVYLTYRTAPVALTETVSSLCLLLRKAPFMLMAPTNRGMTIEAQQMLAENDSVFLALADELTLQSDGSFKVLRRASGRINPAIKAE